MVGKSPLLPPTEEQVKSICENIQLRPEQLNRDVKTIKKWIQIQPHLPNDTFDDTMLGAFIIAAKNSLEITKAKIDMYLTNRTQVPVFYANRDPKSKEILASKKSLRYYVLPSLTPEAYRVSILSLIDMDPDKFNLIPFIKRTLNTMDVKFKTEKYLGGDYYVYDAKGVSLVFLSKFNISTIKNWMHCVEDSLPSSTKGIFFINASPIMETIVNLFKPFLKEKIFNRIKISSEDHNFLYNYIPRDILPDEYGGKAGKMDDLNREWNEYVESFQDWFLEDAKRTVDESKRPEKSVYRPQQLFGIEGSFKKLSID